MAAPTNTLTAGTYTITATGESNGVLIPSNPKVDNPVLTVGCTGTFTSLVLAIRSRITGLTNFYPVPVLKQTDNSVPSNSASISLTNSTAVAFQLSVDGYDATEVYAVSGTPTDLVIEANITSGNGAAPITVAVNAAGAGSFTNVTASGTLAVTGASTLTGALAANGGITTPDSATIAFGDASDIAFTWNATSLAVTQAAPNSAILWGVAGAGIDHVFYGDTSGYNLTWDQSADSLLFSDNTKLAIGDGSDIVFSWDATRLNVTQAATNSEIRWGVDGAGIDQRWYGDTASAYMLWDQSADQCIFGGTASVSGLRVATSGATAITTTRAVTKADSGGIFTAAQSSAYTITVAQPAGAGEKYTFQCVSPGAFDISIVATGCTFEGTIVNDVTSVIPATGSTLKFASGAAVLGDTIELISTSTTKFCVRAVTSAAGGITVS